MTLILSLMLTALAGLALILAIRYLSFKSRYLVPPEPGSLDSLPKPDFDGFVRRFSQMIQLATVSWTDRSKRDEAVFRQFQDLLFSLYPKVHETMTRKVLDDFGLVYHWKGRDQTQKPVLFMAHYDVVPAEEKGEETWQVPPFSGEVRAGVLWGRGTLDIKCMIAFYLEAAETLISQGWQPERDIWFAFGGDEEIGGTQGAARIAALFRDQGLYFEFVNDEGGVISKDQMAFLKGRPAALVGVAEKGFVTFRLRATGQSGHSSMPDRRGTAIGRLARAVARLEAHPFQSRLDPVMRNMLERFVPFVSLGLGVVFSNLWLFSPLIRYVFSKNRVTDSLVRTTQAVTVFKAGEQENILPGEAVCLVNHRILPGQTMAEILARHKRILKDPGVSVEDAGNWPSNNPIVPDRLDSLGFSLVQSVLSLTHPGAVVAPYLVNGATDSKYFKDLTGQIIRFTPLTMTPEAVASIHGVNEKVSLDNLEKGLEFYLRLFLRL